MNSSQHTSTRAVVLEKPEQLALHDLDLAEPQEGDVVVDVEWSGISTGTEKLLYSGRMPMFPGMGYPLVPGYESVGRVREAGPNSGHTVGERVSDLAGSHREALEVPLDVREPEQDELDALLLDPACHVPARLLVGRRPVLRLDRHEFPP